MFQYRPQSPDLPLAAADDPLATVRQLWKARNWALAGAGLGAVAALAVALAWPPTFQSTAQIYIDPQNLRLVQREITPAVPSTDAGVVLIESQARILESTSVLERAAEALDLAADPDFAGGSNPLRALLDPLLGPPAGDADQRVLTALAKAVRAVRLDRTYIVEVHARAREAGKAAAIANAVADAYFALREEQRAEQAGLASNELENRLELLLATLQADEDAVEAFKAANGIVASNGALLAETQLTQANQALAAAGDGVQQAEARLAQLRSLAATPALLESLPEATSSSELQRLRAELDAARRQVDTLSATLGPQHPQLVSARIAAQAAGDGFSAVLNRLVANAELSLIRARDVQQSARSELDRLVGSLQALDAHQIRLRQLTREAEASRSVYEEALLRARETREQAELSTVNAYVVSPASAPAYRSFPPRLSLLLPAAVLAGAGCGLGVALLLARWPAAQPSRTRAELEAAHAG
ncbi:hypothetical protein VE25_07235 [Devosia geojensis]|uniref:Polysaccharide chain length determinant N-terminal domain-containing protein n=1 Tax=Devosia geojensis TaxID=443610 RepID=A0A0F5FUE3_9HYPH|nr:GumC family protein [Devosia geojensis]KKB12453.1 hypothetical protein VE25_07235 [Devosia geojensis]